MKKKEIEERLKFIEVYSEFNLWLEGLGFRSGHYWRESATYMDCHYSEYDQYIDSMHGVEHYVHDVLKLSIRFLRDRNEHKFLFVGDGYTYSEVHSLEKAKEVILDEVKLLKTIKLQELNAINV